MRNTRADTGTCTWVRSTAALAFMLVIGVSVGACTERVAGSPISERTLGRSTSVEPTPPSSSEKSSAATSEGRDGEPSAAAGSAPFDVCTVVTWEDVPAAARPKPENQRPPAQQQPKSEDAFEVGCLFQGQPLQIMVAWGREERMPTTPRGNQGEKAIQIGGKRALMLSTISDKLEEACVLNVELGEKRGVAGVAALVPMSQAGPPEAAPCVVVRQLAEQIVARSS